MIALIVNAAYYGITTICGIYLVSSIYQLVKFNEYIDYLQSNNPPRFRSEIHKIEGYEGYEDYGCGIHAYSEGLCKSPEDYKNDFDEGYDCASEEFLNQCNTSMKSTMEYTEKNLQILESGEKLDIKYVKGALLLLALPKWTLMVNEVPYIVRATPKSVWTTAWVIQEDDSEELDEKLREVVAKSIPNMTDTKIDNLQRLMRKNMYQVLDDLVSIHCHV